MPWKEIPDQPPRRAHVQCWTDVETDRDVRAFAAARGLGLMKAVEQLLRLGLEVAAGERGLRPSVSAAVLEQLTALRVEVAAIGSRSFAVFEVGKVLAVRAGLGVTAEDVEAEAVSHGRARWDVVQEAAASAVAQCREEHAGRAEEVA